MRNLEFKGIILQEICLNIKYFPIQLKSINIKKYNSHLQFLLSCKWFFHLLLWQLFCSANSTQRSSLTHSTFEWSFVWVTSLAVLEFLAHNHPKCDAERTCSLALTATGACAVDFAVAADAAFVRVAQVNESNSDSFCPRRVSFLVSAPGPSRISILLAFRVCGCLPLVLKRS